MVGKMEKIDKGIFISSLLMMGFGIVFVYSSSFALAQQKFGGSDFFLARHIIRVFLALACFVAFINIDYHIIGRSGNPVYIITVALLIYLLTLPDSTAINGAKRWLSIGYFRFQVSELARIVVILAVANQSEKLGMRIREGKIFIKELIKICVLCGLIMPQPDFSTAILIGLIGLCLLFVAGAKILHILGVILVFVPIMIFAITKSPYRHERVMAFINISGTKDNIGYQVNQSLIGLGHGGFFGVGLGQGEQKYFYLPEPHTDFVFSILGEEIGFIGLIIVISIFCFMIYRGMRIALKAPDRMGQILAFGLTLILGGYVILHAFVNTGIVPTTGVPLPFLSYGGMSLIFTMAGMGILLNISSQTCDMKAYRENSIRDLSKRKTNK